VRVSSSLGTVYIEMMDEQTRSRAYRKRKRAEQEAETRLRITEAAVELHRTVGPARTRVTDIAERAGVSRMSVYNHFPTEADLLEGCSAHWAASNPRPDPAEWEAVGDPWDRLRVALVELYGWYRANEEMVANVLRDAPVLAPLGSRLEAYWAPYADEVVRILATGLPGRASGVGEVRTVLGLVIDFHTWQTLSGSRMGDEAAAELAARMVAGVTGESLDRPSRSSGGPPGGRRG
jgi:AcrR family transcriptional regulator